MATHRVFIAVEIPSRMRRQAVDLIESLSHTPATVKWVEGESLHWTLKFLGDVPMRQIPSICHTVSQAIQKLPPFEITAHGAGAFPKADLPRTVWLGTNEGKESFIELHDKIEEALSPQGFRSEHRRFRPHLTLGRVRRSEEGVEELGAAILEQSKFAAGTMIVDEVVIFSSRMERREPVYEVLGRASLLGG